MAIPRRRLVIVSLLVLLAVVVAVPVVVWFATGSPRSTGLTPPVSPTASAAPTAAAGPTASSGSGSPAIIVRTPTGSPPATRDDAKVNWVLAISVDGLNPRAISELGPDGTPTFHRLMREGAWTFNARTEFEQTRTLPNHTGMLTGRRVDAGHGGHGVTFNTDKALTTVHQAAGHYVASVFDVVHDRGGSTALFANKEKFALFQRTWNRDGAPDRTGVDNGREKIDRFIVDTDNDELIAELNDYLRSNPGQFVFVHTALPDEAGHDHGFMGSRYLSAVRETDRLLGTVLDTVSADPTLSRGTLVLVTADHGGPDSLRRHSNPRRPANFRVPFCAWGAGVTAGGDLYDLNPGRRNPGDARTTYDGPQPIRNGDLANLAADALGLPAVPGSQFDADQGLVVG